MAIFKVVQYPDPVLKERTQEVPGVGPKEKTLARDLIDTMVEAKGVGLSANQIGVSVRAFAASPTGEAKDAVVFFNPVITKRSGRVKDIEGCLSVQGVTEDVVRSDKITMTALDVEGNEFYVNTEGFVSRIFQHEIDHLDGKVFLERLGFLKKRKYLKEFLHKA
jgi:peptide deformylase